MSVKEQMTFNYMVGKPFMKRVKNDPDDKIAPAVSEDDLDLKGATIIFFPYGYDSDEDVEIVRDDPDDIDNFKEEIYLFSEENLKFDLDEDESDQ